jgi:AcrR family transcriptional regulator
MEQPFLRSRMTDMRVTAETKELTRRRILEAAQEQFRTTGYEATTTRDIAKAAGIAVGTLFNYFPTKEAIITTLVLESQCRPLRHPSNETHSSLEEALFAHVAYGLRQLKPYRGYLSPVIETSLSPLAETQKDEPGNSFRATHLEHVVQLAMQYGLDAALTPVALQMYWTLYLGILAFWTNDKSPKQEDTFALLDQSLEMFAGWLLSDTKSSD